MVCFYCKYLLKFGLAQNPKFDFSQSLFKHDSNRLTSRRKIGFDTVKFATGSTFEDNMELLKNIDNIISFWHQLLKFVTNLENMSKKKDSCYNNALATIIWSRFSKYKSVLKKDSIVKLIQSNATSILAAKYDPENKYKCIYFGNPFVLSCGRMLSL